MGVSAPQHPVDRQSIAQARGPAHFPLAAGGARTTLVGAIVALSPRRSQCLRHVYLVPAWWSVGQAVRPPLLEGGKTCNYPPAPGRGRGMNGSPSWRENPGSRHLSAHLALRLAAIRLESRSSMAQARARQPLRRPAAILQPARLSAAQRMRPTANPAGATAAKAISAEALRGALKNDRTVGVDTSRRSFCVRPLERRNPWGGARHV
ncbi:hypothetical protein SAMN05421688_2049 [Poseidonocella pacifica]|uniref:Uncharacterized protein n=1 Tax=Poseidonocella pacifica TaxID=871651 RepID=A0A1I0XA95_9RHOB|nr:hypothetical protein SAMN05421688_2049 [Poseidonocella pacifica]